MTRHYCIRLTAALAVAALIFPLPLGAAEGGKPLKPGQYNPAHESVELFEGINEGLLSVKVIHRDESQGRVFIENKSEQPLNVKLPDAFSTVHILPQLGSTGTTGLMGGIGQSSGGAFGGGGGYGGGGAGAGGGGGFFNVAPEKTGELKFVSLCLEHGKPDPRPNMVYEIRPLEDVSANREVREIIKLLAQGRIEQRVAQAAAWHLANEMSWSELAAKRIVRATGATYPYYQPQELQAAIGLTEHISKMLKEGPVVEGQRLQAASLED